MLPSRVYCTFNNFSECNAPTVATDGNTLLENSQSGHTRAVSWNSVTFTRGYMISNAIPLSANGYLIYSEIL